MSEWEPATEAEGAMRGALRANDQEQYFRILARTDIMLPIAPEGPQAGESAGAPGRPRAARTCWRSRRPKRSANASPGIQARTGGCRSASWPTSGPTSSGGLRSTPACRSRATCRRGFVTQITRGDVRLPGRTLGARARIEQASGPKARATAQVPVRSVPNQPAPTPIERHRMKAESAPTSAPPAPTSPAPPAPSRSPSGPPPSGTCRHLTWRRPGRSCRRERTARSTMSARRAPRGMNGPLTSAVPGHPSLRPPPRHRCLLPRPRRLAGRGCSTRRTAPRWTSRVSGSCSGM